MTEDELYRASTQYRLWNFTPERLASLRASTNALAVESVKAAIERKRAAKQAASTDVSATASDADGNGSGSGNGKTVASKVDKEVQCLTSVEEKKLVDFYCSNVLKFAALPPLELPINVTGTAVQFLKRFYLSHSPMDYHPRQIMPAALFLASKTENFHTPLDIFVKRMTAASGLTKLTKEDVLAPEFILTQGLRFCFDVRHTHRGLKGFYLECKLLEKVVRGGQLPVGYTQQSAKNVREKILGDQEARHFLPDIDQGYGIVKNYLNSAALVSDVYFLYTPSQILFAAWYNYSPKLIEWYINMKLENSSNSPLAYKVLKAVRECAALLEQTDAEARAPEDRTELGRIDKKLAKCRNPEKTDLVGLNKAQKRDAGEEGKLDEQVAKRRKLAREKSEKEADDLFGPGLVKAAP